ncbi:sigma-70 family RNA polymerase sigma factor, partial [Tessaracoccus sp. OH4464_COT-324]|uniref:sigma-70 family RNA polymerase sigma factor n=1 Tax=Tessaracoccus sp. OH4464_COT-324 TaxID=2491059 RepID=UPI000F643E6F
EDILAEDAESYDVGTNLRDVDTPENEMLSSELEKVVFDTISNLQEDLKTAITLREMEGLSYEEIAEIMDCPVGTVRSRIFRAREIIESKIQPLLQR